jgi:type IV secretory pathway TraG/TraD family ATPase VirD4
VGGWGTGAWRAAGAIGHGVDRVSGAIAAAAVANGVRPGRHARRSGVLGPDDPPPSGARNTYWDFRYVLLPRQVRALAQGTFPLGTVVHPQRRGSEFPVYLEWGNFEKHTAIIGPPGSGKSRFLIAPWIVQATIHGLTTINVDTKGDLSETIRDAKRELGALGSFRVRRWDIGAPQKSRSWNPIREVRSMQDAAQVAQALLGPVEPGSTHRFFEERDHRWLRGLLRILAAQPGTPHPRELYRMAVSQPYLKQYVAATGNRANDVLDMAQLPAADYPAATAGLTNRLSWLADPTFEDMLAGTGPNAITVDEILTSGGIFIIGARMALGELAWAASSMLISLLKLRVMERFGQLAAPILWTLDEAARYGERINLQEMLDVMRGAGSSICIAVQDVQHLGDPHKAAATLASCDTLITLKGVSPTTANMLGDRLGHVSAPVISHSAGPNGAWQPTVSHQMQPMLGPGEIMNLPMTRRGATVHLRSASAAPFIIDLEP